MFVRLCLHCTGKYRHLVVCCSDAFLFAVASYVLVFFSSLLSLPK